jgi:hypothetical protein
VGRGSPSDAQLASGVLFIDYGLPRHEYYHAERSTGTLRCHYRQRAHDDPCASRHGRHHGSRISRAAEAADALTCWPPRKALLLGPGIEEEIMSAQDETTRIRRASEAAAADAARDGRAIQAIALGRNFSAPLAAFAHRDLSVRQKLSILDLAHVPVGSDVCRRCAARLIWRAMSMALALLAAEHHMPGIASAPLWWSSAVGVAAAHPRMPAASCCPIIRHW